MAVGVGAVILGGIKSIGRFTGFCQTLFEQLAALRELYACAADREHATILFNKWYQWARRCRLEPFKRLALTLKKHLQGVLNAFDSRLSNGRVEGINSLIQAAKARARGYRTSDNLITMAYLIAGKLVHLPSTPYRPSAKPSLASPAAV